MYPASDAFHKAVANGNDQMALMIFSDCVFTNEDINVSAGISFHDTFNAQEDISIGQTLSNSITFSVFNDNELLNNYGFGKFTATLGVKIATDSYQQLAPVVMNTNQAQYLGDSEQPYLSRNGQAVSVQPTFPVRSMLGYDGKVWVFSDRGQFAVYDDKTGTNITAGHKLNAFMRNKVTLWSEKGEGIFYNKNSRILFIYAGGFRDRYEFVPLGVFRADRPNNPGVHEIGLSCFDLMQDAELDMPSASELGVTYPTTIGRLFTALCNYIGATRGTKEFLNDDATISAEPSEFKDATIRTALGWIAEAACSNAKFNRDGELCLEWLKQTNQTYNESSYARFEPYWYKTKKINRLYVRNTNDNSETIERMSGSGNEHYLIQDNPLLRG